MKRLFILGLAAVLLLSCSLTNGATMSAAKLQPVASAVTVSSTPTNQPTPQPEQCTVSAGFLNLRACAGTGCAVIRVLEEGEDLAVLARGGWLEVRDKGGQYGWINSKYCEIGE